jgi:outer membrane lipoprotein-sorting protein
VKIPLQWTIARPLGRFTINVTDVQQNVPIDDSKFEKPAAPAEKPAQK